MRRIVLIFALFALCSIAVSAQPLPPPRVQVPPTEILGSSLDTLGEVLPIYADLRLLVTDMDETDTANEVGEPAHTCASSAATGNSVWFALLLSPGKLTLDTTGTSFITGLGTDSDTVISVYQLNGDPDALTFDSLQPVACHDGGAKAGKIKKLAIQDYIYVIQVSRSNTSEALLAGSSIALKATYTPTVKVKGDTLANARPMTFPFSANYVSLNMAKAELDEPFNPLILPDIAQSIWYKFSLKHDAYLSFSSIGGLPLELVLSLFRLETNGDLTNVEPPIEGIWLLPKGDYRLRISMPFLASTISELGLSLVMPEFAQLLGIQVLGKGNPEFAINDGYEDAVGSLDGWTVTNASPDNALICGAPLDEPEYCGYQMYSVGATGKTTLKTKQKLSSVKLLQYETISLIVEGYSSASNAELTIKVDLTSATGAKDTNTIVLRPTGGVFSTGSGFYVITKKLTPVKAVITVTSMTPDAGEYLIMDTLIIAPNRLFTPGRSSDAFGLK